MPSFGPFTVATYHLFTTLMSAGLPAVVAIVVLTAVLRTALLPLTMRQIRAERRRATLAPQVAELMKKEPGNPAAVLELYRRENVPVFGGLLPMLAQAPFFAVLYSVFLARTIDGEANALLGADLLGVPLGASGGAALPVLLVVLALIAGVATLSARRIRRTATGPAWLAVLPYLSVVFAAFVPLAAAVYLLATTAWSALETAVLRPTPPALT